MRETIQDMAHQIFFDICKKNPMEIDMFFLEQLNFPRIDYEQPRMTVNIPIPREVQGIQLFQGNLFLNFEESNVPGIILSFIL